MKICSKCESKTAKNGIQAQNVKNVIEKNGMKKIKIQSTKSNTIKQTRNT